MKTNNLFERRFLACLIGTEGVYQKNKSIEP
jgi:hypothetical protein